MTYAERYYTDPSICDEELTPEVLEEIGRHRGCAAALAQRRRVSGY